MTEVWRFALKPGLNTFAVRHGAEPLCVATKDGEPQLWVRLNPKKSNATLTILVVPTGKDFTAGRYIGTFQLRDTALGTLVFHAFEHEPMTISHATAV